MIIDSKDQLRQTVWAANSERLKGRIMMPEEIFNRAVLGEVVDLADRARKGEIPINNLVYFITPGSRYTPSDSVSGLGLDWTISQGLTFLETCAGYNREKVLERMWVVGEKRDKV